MSLLLPFAVSAEDRRKKFRKGMEYATVFCLAEIGRNKGRLILRKPPEEIAFIAECCYPIWRVPWGKTTLLFDGLGLRKHTVSFDILPDMDAFIKDLRASCSKTETYFDFLANNLDYFQNFAGKGEKLINGLITDSAFLKDFGVYLSEAKRVRGSISESVILTPFMDEAAVRSSVSKLSELRSNLEDDVRKLNEIVKMLVKMTDKHTNLIMKKNEKIRRRAEREIEQFRSRASKKTERMKRKYDRRILKVSKAAESQLQKLQKTLEELEGRKTQLSVYAKKCETEISDRQARKEDVGLDRWKEELEKCKMELSKLDEKMSEVESNISDIEQSRDLNVSRLKAELSARSETLIAELQKIEGGRDAEIALNEKRMKSLKELTSSFITRINRFFDLRKSAIADLEKIGFQEVRRRYALIHVPFFLACYEQEFKRRYVLFPPSIAHGMRGVTKIKGVFKTSKVEVILDERSKSITMFLNRFLRLINQNPIFEEKLVKAGSKINILKGKEFREKLEKGLERLRSEGWLSNTGFQTYKEQLAKV